MSMVIIAERDWSMLEKKKSIDAICMIHVTGAWKKKSVVKFLW